MIAEKFILIWFMLFATTSNASNKPNQELTTEETKKPKLVLGIVIENMRPDYIQRYWNKFSTGGFKRLYQEGAVCTNVNLNLHVQNYASGTATIFSGVSPDLHGIIDFSWFDRFKKKVVYCTDDENYVSIGAVTNSGNASPVKMLASTITDNLKIFTRGKAKVYSVAMNMESAVFSAGHSSEGAYWFDEKSGKMISSSFYFKTIPDWVRIFNNQNFAEIYSFRNWVTLLPENSYDESLADNYLLEKGYFNKSNTFPHAINKYVKEAGSFLPLKTTPFANLMIKDFAIKMIKNEDIGKDETTDFMTTVFSSMDYENVSFGPASLEMQDSYLYLDKYLNEFIDSVQYYIGKENVLFFLTANTSASFPVQYLKEEFRLPVSTFAPENAVALLSSFLNLTYGEEKWIEYYTDLQIYLDHDLVKKHKLNLKEISATAANFINQFEGILISIPSHELEYANQEFGHTATLGRSFSKNRSGDILYLLKEGWQPSYKYKKVNYTDQSHIPLVFYGEGVKSGKITSKYNAVDIVPTLSELLKIPVPDKCQGKVIEEVIKTN